jgi:hypothetical protein
MCESSAATEVRSGVASLRDIRLAMDEDRFANKQDIDSESLR